MILNETPVRTSKNFLINNVEVKDLKLHTKLKPFKNMTFIGQDKFISSNVSKDFNLAFGLKKELEDEVKNYSNVNLKIVNSTKQKDETMIDLKLDDENDLLIDNIEIVSEENAKGTVIIKYEEDKDVKGYHNGIVRCLAKKDSELTVVLINLLNQNTKNFLSVQNEFEENSKITFIVVDFGGSESITNLYTNQEGISSENNIKCIYLGKDDQRFDLNYIAELRGEKTKVDIDVQGALKDHSKKNFKGTIDFKRGAKKAVGNEAENCMLLSDTARSIALPMLLCSEEDVEGNHSSSAGKIGEKELFYVMTRGINKKEAMKLMVRANFNNILESIKNPKYREDIIKELDSKLD